VEPKNIYGIKPKTRKSYLGVLRCASRNVRFTELYKKIYDEINVFNGAKKFFETNIVRLQKKIAEMDKL
jgi:hypothetical protein